MKQDRRSIYRIRLQRREMYLYGGCVLEKIDPFGLEPHDVLRNPVVTHFGI